MPIDAPTVPAQRHNQAAPDLSARYCINCRWCEIKIPWNSSLCHAPQNQIASVDLVTGARGSRWKYVFCTAQRLPNGDRESCTEAARWFEPREAKEAAE